MEGAILPSKQSDIWVMAFFRTARSIMGFLDGFRDVIRPFLCCSEAPEERYGQSQLILQTGTSSLYEADIVLIDGKTVRSTVPASMTPERTLPGV